MSIRDLISQWPLLRQITTGADGTGTESMTARTRALRPRNEDAGVVRSVCPYCGVGCGQLIFHRNGKVVSIEGDPGSPISEGHLCPKGAAIFQLHVNPNRPTQVLHRAAGAADWEVWELDRAMNRIAELVKKTRDETFIEKLPNGKLVNMTPTIFALGGATLEAEFNHVHQKLMRGLGIVAIENQARI